MRRSSSDRPSVEILTIGDELLRGELVDSNSAWLAARLQELGLPTRRVTTIGDAQSEIEEALEAALLRNSVVITSGGLGPTDDDRTVAAVAAVAGVERALHAASLAHIERIFARSGLTMTPNNEKQAWLPEGAEALLNERGTAPGVAFRRGASLLFCLPGVPHELRWLYDNHVEPRLRAALNTHPAERRVLKVFGIGESQVDHRLANLLAEVPARGCAVTVHYRATFPEIHVTLLVRPADGVVEDGAMEEGAMENGAARAAVEVADALTARAEELLGSHLFARDEQGFAEAIVEALTTHGARLALAESCTGGLAADMLTNAAGSSAVFELGAVVYANAMKEQILSVPRSILDGPGAVSRECVEAMALGIRQVAGATYGVAISGIAGPGGGTAEKPVGTVHFALAGPDGVRHLHRVFPYDRRRNKKLAAYIALWLALREVRGLVAEGDPLAGRWQASVDASTEKTD